jgi:hypothetical protein
MVQNTTTFLETYVSGPQELAGLTPLDYLH